MEHLRNILFNEINLDKCDLYYCIYCSEFCKKSKLNLNDKDLENNQIRNLTCTKCNKYLIRENEIVRIDQQFSSTPNEESKIESEIVKNIQNSKIYNNNKLLSVHRASNSQLSLRDALTSTQHNSESGSEYSASEISEKQVVSNSEIIDEKVVQTDFKEAIDESNSNKSDSIKDKLKSLLVITQINKAELDEINNEAKRISNNLKLYLIIDVFNKQESDSSKEQKRGANNLEDEKDDEEENLHSVYNLRYITCNIIKTGANGSEHLTKFSQNVLCVLTNKNIILFDIFNPALFIEQKDFDKCLRKEYVVNINQVEYLDIGLGQHYFQLQICKSENEPTDLLKFVTLDMYQTQSFMNNILSKRFNKFQKVFKIVCCIFFTFRIDK